MVECVSHSAIAVAMVISITDFRYQWIEAGNPSKCRCEILTVACCHREDWHAGVDKGTALQVKCPTTHNGQKCRMRQVLRSIRAGIVPLAARSALESCESGMSNLRHLNDL